MRRRRMERSVRDPSRPPSEFEGDDSDRCGTPAMMRGRNAPREITAPTAETPSTLDWTWVATLASPVGPARGGR